jgi:hypothetical protein
MKRDALAWLFAVAVALAAMGARPALAGCGPGVTHAGSTWTVSPNGVDDTRSIQCALDKALATGRGKTVRLQPGTFHVGMIRIRGFDGYFKGSGMDVSRITPVLNLPCPDSVAQGIWPALIAFEEGYPRISDLTFEMTIDQMDPCLPYTAPWDPVEQTDLGALLVVGGRPITQADSGNCEALEPAVGGAKIERVRFKGPYPSTQQAQDEQRYRRYLEHAVNIGGWGVYGSTYCTDWIRPFTGKFTITSSVFEDVPSAGSAVQGLLKGTVNVGGSPQTGNRFKDVGFAFLAMGNDKSTVDFSYNEADTQCLMSVGAWQAAPWVHNPQSPSTVLFHHNRLRVSGTADAIFLQDFGPPGGLPPTLNAVVARNTIALADTQYGGIGAYGAQNATILANEISGNGMAGIYAGLWGDTVTGWRILGNNVEGVNVPPATAPIWLGAGTSRLLVVGDGHPTGVLDEGTGNILVNVDKMEPGR